MILQRHFRVSGIVQGVGFRPYVWHLAQTLNLVGWVRNDAAGVEIRVQGDCVQLDIFTQRLPREIPLLSQIRELTWVDMSADDTLCAFNIIESAAGLAATMIGHDTTVCADCLAEMFDPADRRWRYAFINCTHCGPRYTLTRKLPYDRAQTSMAAFPLCLNCAQEYHDPTSRRFHAEPTACPVCGPRLTLTSAEGEPIVCADPIVSALDRIQSGQIVALKGLGGFHLACDARNTTAVKRMRLRKNRDEKPFAIMAANLASIMPWVAVNEAEATLLQSPERPIVLLRKNQEFPGIAPGLAWLGVMLPYTPMHLLLFHAAAEHAAGTAWMAQPQNLLLVMTSANPGGEPLVINNIEAIQRLHGIADAILLHDRDIIVRCDDTVLRCGELAINSNESPQFIRRARGYTPRAIRLPRSGASVLALGGYLKNTICVTRGDEAFVSQHIGSLNNPASCNMLIEVSTHLLDILQVKPVAIAHDLHPDFFSSRYALERAEYGEIPAIAVQHHHAHIAAVAAEHRIMEPILGLALDGIGLGSDGSAWGGELLRLDGGQFTRLGHLVTLALPGGDQAAKEPWRMAAAALHRLGRGKEIARRFSAQPAAMQLETLLTRGLHCPPSSSLGRWFDAAAGLLGIRDVMTYEGQAAMLLEGLAAVYGSVEPMSAGYHIHEFPAANGSTLNLDLLPLLERLTHEKNQAYGAALFHATLAHALADWAQRVAQTQGLTTVAFGGGCFLNAILTRHLTQHLNAEGFTVLTARQVPPNDGGLSLGQAWIASQKIL